MKQHKTNQITNSHLVHSKQMYSFRRTGCLYEKSKCKLLIGRRIELMQPCHCKTILLYTWRIKIVTTSNLVNWLNKYRVMNCIIQPWHYYKFMTLSENAVNIDKQVVRMNWNLTYCAAMWFWDGLRKGSHPFWGELTFRLTTTCT